YLVSRSGGPFIISRPGTVARTLRYCLRFNFFIGGGRLFPFFPNDFRLLFPLRDCPHRAPGFDSRPSNSSKTVLLAQRTARGIRRICETGDCGETLKPVAFLTLPAPVSSYPD